MMLVVESGATKADWCLCGKEAGDGSPQVRVFRTPGINAAVMCAASVEDVVSDFARQAGPELLSEVRQVHFYAAGVVSEETSGSVRQILSGCIPCASHVEVASDLLAAARALFGDGDGVAAIMGTGSNSCLYEGGRIVSCIRSGGFILGDEGSAAALGRMFLSDYFKDLVPDVLASDFRKSYPEIDYASAVRNIYKGETPSRYLASFAPFVTGHRDDPYAEALVAENVRSFVVRSLSRYGCGRVGVTGSFGLACMEELKEACRASGLEVVSCVKAPLEALVAYHSGRS